MKKFLVSALVLGSVIGAASTGTVSAKTIESPIKLSNPIKAGISGTIQINGTTYKWIETSWGKNRGMTFNPGNNVYQMTPNPHDDPWYNKNQQKFYNQAAVAIKTIGDQAKWTTKTWPASISGVTVHGVTYNLDKR